MRRLLPHAFAVIALLAGTSLTRADADSGCGEYGTSVKFFKTPSDAATQAKKEQKLVMVLHVSGQLRRPRLHLKQRRSAPCERPGQCRSRQVRQRVLRARPSRRSPPSRSSARPSRAATSPPTSAPPTAACCTASPARSTPPPCSARPKWVVETAKKAIEDAKGDGGKFKAAMRKAHADKLRTEHGAGGRAGDIRLRPTQDTNGALTYSDPTGRPLAPKLPPPPIDGPDVTIKAKSEQLQAAARAMARPGSRLAMIRDRRGGRAGSWATQGRVHMLLAGHSMVKIEKVYGAVFEGILGEKITTKPVEIVHPFPWHARKQLQEKNCAAAGLEAVMKADI